MPKKIDDELKARAVRLVTEHRQEYPTLTAACQAAARKVGVGKESVRRWVRQAEVDAGDREGRTSEELAEIKELKARIRRLESDNQILKEATVFFGSSSPQVGGAPTPQPTGGTPAWSVARGGIVSFIDRMRALGHAVESICAVLREQGCQVAARSYRAWRAANRQVAARTITDAHIANLIRDIAWKPCPKTGRLKLTPEGLYGRRKMTALVRRQLPEASAGAVDRAMRMLGLSGVRRDKKIRTTIPAKDGKRAGDLLDRNFPPQAGGAPTHHGPITRGSWTLPQALRAGWYPHVRSRVGRLGIHRVHRRRLCSADCGLARPNQPAHRPGNDPVTDGAMATKP